MDKIQRHHEVAPERVRLPYGAVPWDPWKAAHPLDTAKPYLQVSLEHIYDILHRNMTAAVEGGYPISRDKYRAVEGFIEDSLRNAQVQRIAYNGQHPMPETLRGSADTIRAAKEGTATPAELLELLAINPDIPSTELAKQSHPFNFESASALDRAVIDAITGMCHEWPESYRAPVDHASRYKIKRIDVDIPAASLVQKKHLGDLVLGPQDTIRLMRRRTLFIRGDDEVVDNSGPQPKCRTIKRALEDPDAAQRLISSVDEALQSYEHALESPWVQPISTSVYAYRPDHRLNHEV